MTRVLFLFLDGVGIGPRDASINPFARANLPVLSALLGGIPFSDRPHVESERALVIPLDANLDVEGLPQSGTGQTTLFTGQNAAALLGEHYGPYPDERLGMLLAYNIFHRLHALHKTAMFANAYPPIFFERIARGTDRRSATAQAVAAANVPYRMSDDLRQGRAVSASLTNERWPQSDDAPPIITPRQAGQNLELLARDYDFTLFEFFLTDVAGHRPARMSAVTILERIDEFVGGILLNFDLDNALLFITSDHGNIEDSSSRRHTRNPVPAIIAGAQRQRLAARLHSLADVTPAIVELITDNDQ
jgi:2,3-bisphosphoglycerate-independent phosphoglycerate mutase